jgi:hypothetical protein
VEAKKITLIHRMTGKYEKTLRIEAGEDFRSGPGNQSRIGEKVF